MITHKQAQQVVAQCNAISKVQIQINFARKDIKHYSSVTTKSELAPNKILIKELAHDLKEMKDQMQELQRGLSYIQGALALTLGIEIQLAYLKY